MLEDNELINHGRVNPSVGDGGMSMERLGDEDFGEELVDIAAASWAACWSKSGVSGGVSTELLRIDS